MYVRNMIISVEFMKISSRLPYPFFLNKILSIFYNVSCKKKLSRYTLNYHSPQFTVVPFHYIFIYQQ